MPFVRCMSRSTRSTRPLVTDFWKRTSGSCLFPLSLKPQKVLATAQFMAKIGTLRQAPASIDELFFAGGDLKGD